VRAAPLLLLLAGCGGGESEIVTMEGFGYGWDLFNHRLSYLHAGVDAGADDAGGEASIAVVGGTSTTGVTPQLDDTCDPDTCGEFPFVDDSLVELRWARAVSRGVIVGTGTIDLAADADGDVQPLVIELPNRGDGDVVALIGKLVIDTDRPTSDGADHCYDPGYGWHPRRIAVQLGEPTLDGEGTSVSLDVNGFFEAGNSLEEERACIDEINELAVASMTVGVTVIVGADDVEQQDVLQGAAWECGDCPYDPNEQPDPDPAERPLEMSAEGRIFGWSSLDWRFHADDPEGRGAYLRTLSFDVDADGGVASGHATNFSPATQLSGFDYAFEGVARGVAVSGDPSRGTIEATLPAELDDAGFPVVTTLPLE
jgi:hypothetical protein